MTRFLKIFFFLLIISVLFSLTIPLLSHAQGGALEQLEQVGEGAYGVEVGTPPKSIAEIVGGTVKIFLSVLGVIAAILIIYGGALWMTARGKEERITKAKDTLEAAIIGLIIVLAAYAITYFIVDQLMKAAGAPVTP